MRERKKIGKRPKNDHLDDQLDKLLDASDDPWYEDVMWWIEDTYKCIRSIILNDIPNCIFNLIHYSKFLWKLHHWDYCYTMMFEKTFAKIALARYEKGDGVYICDEAVEEHKRDLRLLIKVMDMIDNVAELDEDAEINMNNKHRFINKEVLKNPRWQDDDNHTLKVMVREAKMWNLYHLIRRYKLREIWD